MGDSPLRPDPKILLNLVQDLAASRTTGTILAFTINAAGSPATDQVVVRRFYDLEERIKHAKEISSIQTQVAFYLLSHRETWNRRWVPIVTKNMNIAE